jgi:hypothetical protein
LDNTTKEEVVVAEPTSEEQEIISEHQSRIIVHDGLLGNISDFISNSGCMDCNRKLDWELLFDDNNKNIARSYIAKHCRRLYSIQLETAGVRVAMLSDEEARKQVHEQKSKRNEKEKEESKKQKDKELEDKKQADLEKAKKDAEKIAQLAEDEKTRTEAARVAKLAETQKQGLEGGIFKSQGNQR